MTYVVRPVAADEYKPNPKLLALLPKSKITLLQGLSHVKSPAVPLSAKFELDDKGKLSLSIYAASQGLQNTAKSALKEISGSPETATWQPGTETLSDAGDIAAATQQIKILAKTRVTLVQIAHKAQGDGLGTLISITPTATSGRAKFVVFFTSHGAAREADYDLNSGQRLAASP